MKTKIFAIGTIVLLAFAACNSSTSTQGKVTNVDAAEFKRLMDSIPNEQLVDVRTAEEYGKGHIDNAVNYDWNGDNFSTQAAALSKDQPVFVYCLSGGRSSEAANWFLSNGYKNVYQMTGGIRAWENADLPEVVTTAAVANPGEITPAAYADFIKKNPVVLVDFSATWCGPCQHLKPKIEELQTELAGKFVLLSSDVDRDSHLADSMNIEAMPTLIIYKNGELKWRQTGDLDKSELSEAIMKVQ